MKRIFPAIAALALTGSSGLTGCSGTTGNDLATVAPDDDTSTPTGDTDSPRSLPDGTLSKSDLVAHTKYRLTYAPPDQFTKEPNDNPLNGRTFHLEIIGVGDGIDAPLGSMPLRTSYNANDETLDLTVDASSVVPHSDSDVINYLTIYEDDQDLQPEIMSNAFGVQKQITYVKQMKLGVGNVGGKIGVFKTIPHDGGFLFELSKKIHIDAEKAKTYDKKYILTVDGEIFSDKNGKIINCQHDKEQPTIDKSRPSDETACIINSKLRSIAVLDPDRRVLAQWGVR